MATLFLTGASGGLSAAIREKYIKEGWKVAGFDRRDDGFSNLNYRYFESDATNEASMLAAFDRAKAALDAPRALIATVGGVKPWKPVDEIEFDEFSFLINLNLVSTFIALKLAIKMMRAVGLGSIITIGAEPALRPEAKKAGYVAGKAAMIALTRVVAEEGKEFGVNANVIVPTTIHTLANESWGTPSEIAKWTEPNDIAATCFFLTSDPGHSINGAVIRIPNKL